MDLGVQLHPGHRAALDDGFVGDEITTGSVTWTTGQAPESLTQCCGRSAAFVRTPAGCPESVLDAEGFVRVNDQLRVPGHPGVFAVGDVAASDPLRGSARNRADRLVARNVRAELAGAFITWLPSAQSEVGISPRRPTGRARGVHTLRPPVSLPGLVDRPCAATVDRQAWNSDGSAGS